MKIENWSFIRTEIYFDEEQNLYKTRICSMAKDFSSKLNLITGIINSGTKNEELFTSNNGIDVYSEDSVKTLTGEIFYLGTINPYYSAFKNAVDMEMPIMSEVSLTRGLAGEYLLKGKLYNTKQQTLDSVFKRFKRIVGQSVDKNLLYFANDSYAFVDWVNAQFDDKVKLDIIRKRLDFKEYVGLSIMPIFKF